MPVDPVGQYTFTRAPISVSGGMGPTPGYSTSVFNTDDNGGYIDDAAGNWAPSLREFPGGVPDASRLKDIPRRDFRPEPEVPPDYFWSGIKGPGRDRLERHSVEFQDADGFMAIAPAVKSEAPNPRNFPPPEPRPTSRLAPRTYLFTRPWGQDMERYFNGNHFSMADHRRRYPILGMAPFTRRRNTYRADPPPWDSDLIDEPNPQRPETPGRIVAFDVPPSAGQSWRL